MWYSKQLRLVRRARRAARAQQHLLFALELEGIVALTLHSATGRLTIPIERAAGAKWSIRSSKPCATGAVR